MMRGSANGVGLETSFKIDVNPSVSFIVSTSSALTSLSAFSPTLSRSRRPLDSGRSLPIGGAPLWGYSYEFSIHVGYRLEVGHSLS
jgi:hypothetical protein